MKIEQNPLRTREDLRRAAAELLSDGNLIFIDSSTTVLSMVDFLSSRRNLTIVSNSLLLMTLMKAMPTTVRALQTSQCSSRCPVRRSMTITRSLR